MAKKEWSHLAHFLHVEPGGEPAAALDDIVAIDGVEYLLALLTARHQAELLEDIQMVGDGRLHSHTRRFHPYMRQTAGAGMGQTSLVAG